MALSAVESLRIRGLKKTFISTDDILEAIIRDLKGLGSIVLKSASSTEQNIRIKQTEVNFGDELNKNYAEFTILDSDCTSDSKIIASVAYEAPFGRTLDEVEMDPIICTAASPTLGSFKLQLKGLEGSLRKNYKINYTISWQ